MSFTSLKRKLLLSLVFGLAVVLALVIYADLPKIAVSLGQFGWQYLPLILGLTLLNYGLRFVKWHLYLRLIGTGSLGAWESLLIFFSGLSMVMTPGKVGEWLKSYLLKETTGTPISTSAPIIVAERLTDALAMLVLASGGLLIYGYNWQVLLLLLVAALAVVLVSQYRPLAMKLLSYGGRLPLVARRIHHFEAFYESSHELFRLRNLLWAVALGFISWAGECAAFYFVLVGLGLEQGPLLLIQAAFVLAASTLIGSSSMSPGGLAVAEGSIAGLLLLMGVTADMPTAVAATLLIRVCTLWFGVAVGILALLVFSRSVQTGETASAARVALSGRIDTPR